MIRALFMLAIFVLVVSLAVACTQSEGAITFIAPTPTPSPAATPTPTPVPAQLLVQTGAGAPAQSIAMQFTSAGAIQNFTASESNYSGAIAVTNTCSSGVVTLAPGSGTGPSQPFSLTSVAAGGPCTVTLHDTFGQTATVTVNVATTSGTVQ